MVAFLTVMGVVLLNLLIAFLTGAHSEVQKLARAKVGDGLGSLTFCSDFSVFRRVCRACA